MAVHLLTGHQTTNHISALEEAAAQAAMSTADNAIIASSQNVSCYSTFSGTTGTITVTSFTALFSGRKVVATEPTATCTLPDSDTTYKHVSVGIRYEKDTSDGDVETCSLVAYTSASVTSNLNSAKTMSTGAPSTHTIDGDTTQAYFELFDLVVNASGIVTSKTEKKYKTLPSVESIKNDLNMHDEEIDELQEWRDDTNTDLTDHGNRITTLETWKTSAAPQISSNQNDIGDLYGWATRKTNNTWYTISDRKIQLNSNDAAMMDAAALCIFSFDNGVTVVTKPYRDTTIFSTGKYANNTPALFSCVIEFNSNNVIRFADGKMYGRYSTSYSVDDTVTLPFTGVRIDFLGKAPS